MTKLTRKINVDFQYLLNNGKYVWENILSFGINRALPMSRKRIKRIYFDRKVKMITNVGIPSKDSYSLRKSLVNNTEPFDLGKAIKWLPELFRVRKNNKETSLQLLQSFKRQRNNDVVLQHEKEVRYKVEPKRKYKE